MPISNKHKILFVHVPKCAGTTVEQMLDMSGIHNLFSTSYSPDRIQKQFSFENFSQEEKEVCLLKNMQHYSYIELKKLLPQKIFDSYYKFSIVRNPYDRIVSEFLYAKNCGRKLKKNYFYNFSTFKEFVSTQLTIPIKQRIEKYDAHLETQKSFLINEQGDLSGLDKIYKMETELDDCLKFLNFKIGVDLKIHARKNYYDRSIADFYDGEIQELVYNFYKEDFNLFGYGANL